VIGDLTPRQQEILDFLKDFQEGSGFPPTIQEIRDHFKFASPQTVVDHLKALKKKNAIRITPRISRGIEIVETQQGVPILGQIAAGSPLLAVENVLGHLPLGKEGRSLKADFALEVKGDSMIQAGILEGDHVLIQKTTNVRSGEIVAALLDGEGTVKRFFEKDGRRFLKPENDRYDNIPLDRDREDIQILGRVTGVLRKY
jgi:repressor LexA